MQLVLYTHNKNTTQQIEIDCKKVTNLLIPYYYILLDVLLTHTLGAQATMWSQERMLIKSPSPFAKMKNQVPCISQALNLFVNLDDSFSQH